jgi:HEAT repeat protein
MPLTESMRYVRILGNRTPAPVAERAAEWLISHPDEAHPTLLEVLRERGPEAKRILALLPRFGRDEAVDVVSAVLMSNDELLSFDAARCLAIHPSERAITSLSEALAGPVHTRKAALEGLALRNDPSLCEPVAGLLNDEDANVRQRAARAAQALGCLTPERLKLLANDPSEAVRALAAELRLRGP